jgi:hypothetical protein
VIMVIAIPVTIVARLFVITVAAIAALTLSLRGDRRAGCCAYTSADYGAFAATDLGANGSAERATDGATNRCIGGEIARPRNLSD